MKNCIYFAANSEKFTPRLTPGWGFDAAGGLRRGAGGLADGVLLDDRFPPAQSAAAELAAALRAAPLVVCDCERAPTPALAELVRQVYAEMIRETNHVSITEHLGREASFMYRKCAGHEKTKD